MKVEQLIAELQKLPAETEMLIFDGSNDFTKVLNEGPYPSIEILVHYGFDTVVAALHFDDDSYQRWWDALRCLKTFNNEEE